MSISSYLKIIGRGSKGSGDLDREQAREVFTKILSGTISDLELGAFCIAMRIKGESVAELLGFMDAIDPTLHLLESGSQPTIILPSYNGARKQANLTPLLAGLLSAQGFQVIVQGVTQDDARVTSYEIFEALHWPILHSVDQWSTLREKGLPIFCPLGVIAPSLQRLLDIRATIGLRNSGHVLAKLITPFAHPVWQISNYTHPEYPHKLKEYFVARSSHAILMRGNEGEPTASLQRLPEMHFLGPNHYSQHTQEERFEQLLGAVLGPTDISASTTAQWTNEILAGNCAAPASVLRQTQQITQYTHGVI